MYTCSYIDSFGGEEVSYAHGHIAYFTIVWKYFVGKNFSWACYPQKILNMNNNKVYLCNCDTILES